MRESKLGLDFQRVDYAKNIAKNISDDVQNFVNNYSTVAVERTLCRLIGIDGVNSSDIPLPNVVVDFIKDKGMLKHGVLFLIGNAIINTGLTPQEIAEKISNQELDITTMDFNPESEIHKSCSAAAANRPRRRW